ncbi:MULTISPECIES: hypothetical protein [Allobacillus]|nr:hypothetical protein [Allobacillus salarius]
MTTAKCLAKTVDVLYIEQAVEKPRNAAEKSSEAAGISWRNRYLVINNGV